MSVIIFFIILFVLVLVHEWGHFFTAKKFGIRVDEFGFGFPPKIASVKKGETEYSFNLLPFGGFVKIFGEDPNDENTKGPDAGRSFVNKPKWQQAIVLFAGVFMNFLLAWFLFSFGFMSGLPTSVSNAPAGMQLNNVNLMIISVLPKSPAENGGLKAGDKIISFMSGADTLTEVNPKGVQAFIGSHPESEIEVNYLRGKDNVAGSVKIIPEAGVANGKPGIGISMDEVGILKLPFFPALWQGLKFNWSVTKGTAVGLYDLIRDSIRGQADLSSITGPVGIVGAVGDAYEGFGFAYLLSFAALISINLAIINLIPFPALDGGRLFFLLIEKIKGSPINRKVANMVNLVGFSLLILLMLVVTYNDIVKLF